MSRLHPDILQMRDVWGQEARCCLWTWDRSSWQRTWVHGA